MWGIKSVLGPHTSTHFPTSSPLPSPHPFPTRQHTSPLTPYTFPHPPHTSPLPHIFSYLPHTPTHFPTSPPTPPYLFPQLPWPPSTPQHTSLFTPCTLPHLSPHILPHSFDYVAKLTSNSKSPIKFFTATGNLKSCFGVGNVNFRCMTVWRSYHVAKLPCGEVTGNHLIAIDSGQDLSNYRSSREDNARLDVSGRGVWSPFDCTFVDIRVTHPNCQSNRNSPSNRYSDSMREKKKRSTSKECKT